MSDIVSSLPLPPPIALAIARDRSATSAATGGFLDLARLDLVATFPDGRKSEPFPYDLAHRASLDAAVMAAHFAERGERFVYLRSTIRPPIALRRVAPRYDGALWELPAGLIDPGETPAQAAARELGEELGFDVAPDLLAPLGGVVFPAPAMCGERQVFFHVEVDPKRRSVPSEDGSVLERGAHIVAAPLARVLDACRRGEVPDAKTELALRRLAEVLA